MEDREIINEDRTKEDKRLLRAGKVFSELKELILRVQLQSVFVEDQDFSISLRFKKYGE